MSRREGSALVTVLFTDIVGSTEVASELGNRRWRELLGRHHRIVRRELRRFGGREIDTAGDGFFATFDRPAQGIRCAWAVTDAVRALGIEVRAGLHVGESELMGKQVGGVAVHIGARIGSQSGPGEVLVSGTLRDLVPGAGIEFKDQGWRDLRGVAEAQRLFAVAAVDGEPRPDQLPAREASRRRAQIVPPQPLRRRGALVGGAIVVALALTTVAVVLSREDSNTSPSDASGLSDVLVRVDGQTSRRSDPIALAEGGGQRTAQVQAPSILIGQGAVWVRTTGNVFRVGTETGEQAAAERIGTYRGADMALGLRAVWLASTGHGEVPGVDVIGLNPATLETEVEARFPTALASPQIATTDEAVWVGYGDRLLQINPQTGKRLGSLPFSHGMDQLLGTGHDLWVVDSLAHGLFLFDTAQGNIDETVTLQVAPDDVEVGIDGDLWVLNRAGGILLPVSAAGDVGAPIAVGTDPSDVAVSGDSVWVADRAEGVIRKIDPVLGEVERNVHVGGSPVALAIDPETGDVWVFLG